MPNILASKGKAPPGKPPSTSPPATRSTSRTGLPAPGTPLTPGDSPEAPVKPQLPSTKAAAKRLLSSQNLIDNKAPVIATSITYILTHLSARPDIPEIVAQIVQSVNLLLPDAFEAATSHKETLEKIHEKLDGLTLIQTPPDEPPVDQSERLSNLEAKLDSLVEVVSKSQASAGAAESAAIETQRSLVAFHQDVAWQTVPERGAPRHRSPVAAAPNTAPPQNTSRVPTARQEVATAQRLRSQGCYFLVDPGSNCKDSLAKLDARALVLKAELAFEAAWEVLQKTEFVKEDGKGTRPDLKFVAAVRLARGGIRYQMGDRTQAAYLSDARVCTEFEKGFGDVSCKGQGAPLLLQCAPVTWKPDDPAAIRALELENYLHPGDILSASWVKPVHKRKADQEVAVVKLALRSQEVADRLITEGGQLECNHVTFSKVKQEPVRCLRCQLYGHIAKKCKGLGDICSQCGAPHRSVQCDQPDKKYCASCKSDAHCSYDRSCPAYRERMEQLNVRKPENKSRYYDTKDDGHAHILSRRPIHFPSRTTLGDVVPGASRPSQSEAFRAYFTRQPGTQERSDSDHYQRQIGRKPRGGSESWDTAEVITAPRQPSTPTRDPVPHLASPPPALPRSSGTTFSLSSFSPGIGRQLPASALLNQYSPSRPVVPAEFPLTSVSAAQRRASVTSVSSVSTA